MDPDAVKSTLTNLAYGNVMAAAARDLQKEMVAKEKAQTSKAAYDEVDLDELMDDPELEKLHAERIASLKTLKNRTLNPFWVIPSALPPDSKPKETPKTNGTLFGRGARRTEHLRCQRIMDKHLKALAPKHGETKFIKVDAENAPFFVTKLGIKTLPCVILFRKGIASDRLVGFEDLGAKDDFSTITLENLLIKKGILSKKKKNEDDDDYSESTRRSVRSSAYSDSDSD
ncbi:hypothetical protein KSS87_004281 [Heliosperma pusillum]|nr:hypothetical protein KSS87_004281 [Heliosperma pusillum]